MIKHLTGADAFLDLILTKEEEFGCSDQVTVVFGQNSFGLMRTESALSRGLRDQLGKLRKRP